MRAKPKSQFNPQAFLAQVGGGKTRLACSKKQKVFSQGDAADAVFYIQSGKVTLSVVSEEGKEAIITVLEEGAFLGEGCLAGQLVYMATATTLLTRQINRVLSGGTHVRLGAWTDKMHAPSLQKLKSNYENRPFGANRKE